MYFYDLVTKWYGRELVANSYLLNGAEHVELKYSCKKSV